MQSSTDYLSGRDRFFADFAQQIANANGLNSHQFNLCSANLFKFLPSVDFQQHATIFQEIVLHNRLSHFEQLHAETFDYMTCENLSDDYLQLLKKQPCVLSTFHFGSYRLFTTFLIKNKIPYTIVIPKDILASEGETLRKIYADGGSVNDAKFIEVESPALGLKMLRELKSGRSIFIYFDGYRGAGDVKQANKNEGIGKIDFLGQQIYARKGVAYLANAANVPLITAFSYRKKIDDIRLHFFDPVMPDRQADKDQFAHHTTQLLYDQFSVFLKQYPGQWEAWLYLHRLIDTETFKPLVKANRINELSSNSCDKFSFNGADFGIFKVEEDKYLFNKQYYKTHPLQDTVYDILLKCTKGYIQKDDLVPSVFDQLVNNNVLVPYAGHLNSSY